MCGDGQTYLNRFVYDRDTRVVPADRVTSMARTGEYMKSEEYMNKLERFIMPPLPKYFRFLETMEKPPRFFLKSSKEWYNLKP